MSKLLGQLEKVKAVSVLLGACIALKTIESFTGANMAWVDPLMGTASGAWFVAVNVKRGNIGDDDEADK